MSADLLEKLAILEKDLAALHPTGNRDEDSLMGLYRKEVAPILIDELARKLQLTLKFAGYPDEAHSVDGILGRHDKEPLFQIQEGGPWEGEYAVVRELQDLISYITFAIGDVRTAGRLRTGRYQALLEILRGIDRSFTVTQSYPRDETELHRLVESILICSFSDLKHKPTIDGAIKAFEPDTGIPETKTLIEYKFIDSRKKVPRVVDELFADGIGYADAKWDNLICVVYETARFVTESAWRKEIARIQKAEVVLIKGTRPRKTGPSARTRIR